MRNTGIVYSSTERTPIVLPELAGLLPPLTGEQLGLLEEDIRRNGCYSPIVVNENLEIVDGHNRYDICQRLGIPFEMKVFAFEDTLDAMQWAVDTQKGRRNLDTWELGKIALKLKPEVEARAKANMSAGGGDHTSAEAVETRKDGEGAGLATLPNPLSQVDTRKELAESVGIGARTMGKVMQIDENAPQAVKDALDKKEISVNQGYNITRELRDVPEEEREKSAEMAVEMAKAKKEIRRKDAEADRRGKIAAQFCKAVEKSIILEATEENIRLWVEGARMRPDEIALYARESREISEIFAKTADLLETLYPAESIADAPDQESDAPEAEALPEDGEPWDGMEQETGEPDTGDEPEDSFQDDGDGGAEDGE
ncbi:MAG: ParB N-terminal domain-containing protein [Oscillibacter sp.]|nr:ParB N-terminal domain-containing protein [Oscillibacter sp.]